MTEDLILITSSLKKSIREVCNGNFRIPVGCVLFVRHNPLNQGHDGSLMFSGLGLCTGSGPLFLDTCTGVIYKHYYLGNRLLGDPPPFLLPFTLCGPRIMPQL